MTQLVELRDALPRFESASVRLYAISYDDVDALAAFARTHDISYPLLSDADSAVIRRFGILNTLVEPGDAPTYGVPFPGAYVVDSDGRVVEKFFSRHHASRESAETLIDTALGRILLGANEPSATAEGEDAVRISATLHGGAGTLREGARRRMVVRFELADGLHIYGRPVPDWMVPTTIAVDGPPGLVTEEPIYPPTRPHRIEPLDLTLPIWSGVVDVVVPVYAVSELVPSTEPLMQSTAELEVQVRYQACTDRACLPPHTATLRLRVELEPATVPNLALFDGTGQRKTGMNTKRHLRRLFARHARRHPFRFARAMLRRIWLR